MNAVIQVWLAQWMPSKALAELMAATQFFQQASQAQMTADLDGKLQRAHNGLTPQLWLQCRLQVCAGAHFAVWHVLLSTRMLLES